MDVAQVENADSKQKAVGQKPYSLNDFVKERVEKAKAKPAKEEPKPEKTAEKEPEKKPKEAEKPEPKAEKKEPEGEVLSHAKSEDVDENGLTNEEKAVLEKARSKLLVRVGELTAKRKTAEETLAQMQARLEAQPQQPSPEPIKDNPFSSIKDTKELEQKAREIKEVIDFFEEKLDDATDLGQDDVAATVDGKEYTKRQMRDTLRRARKARDEYLPDVASRLAVKERSKQLRTHLEEKMRKELPWLSDDKDERSAKFAAMAADPRLKAIEDVAPEVAAQMPFLLAHAANSMFARRLIPTDDAEVVKPKRVDPPENASSGAAAGGRMESDINRQAKELSSRFEKTGSLNDWVNLRAVDYSKRKQIK